jgi:hypothetical protein
MREFKFFRGIIRDELIDMLSEEIRQEIDSEIIRNLMGTYPFPLTGTGTITTNGDYALTTTNTGTANYTTLTATNIANTNYTTTASDNLRYLNHYINMEGGNRA